MTLYDTFVGIAKSYGLFYLIGLSLAVCIYAYWPANRKGFDHAANAIFEKEDKPCP